MLEQQKRAARPASDLAALYASFARQRHAKKELLVLDTGAAAPSPFFAALDDARVRYVHEPDLVTGDDGDAEKVGIKRNRLCALARGDAMACFDDDNVYGPDYLRVMLAHLRHSAIFRRDRQVDLYL